MKLFAHLLNECDWLGLAFCREVTQADNEGNLYKISVNYISSCIQHKTPWANFINILRSRFSYQSELSSFSLIMFGFVIFGAKILYKNASIKRWWNW